MATTVNPTATNGLRRLLTTNAAPTQPEADFFQDVIHAKEEAIRKLQYEITKHRGILSPLRRFPLEILGEIFTLVLDTIQDLDGIPYQVVDISLVCKTWRSAALATPRLWNRLAIRLKGETSCIEKYGCWLRRAGRVPCSIALDPTLERGYCAAGGHIEGYCSLLKTGLPEFLSTSGINIGMLSVRCHSSHCLGLLSERVKSIANPSNRPWDAVRSFEVIPAVDAPWDPEVAPLLPHFPNAITSLNLSFSIAEEDFTDEDIGTMGAVLGKLKEFNTMLTWPLALNKTILGLCTNLQSLTLTIDSETEEELETGSVITLPRLTRLRIEEVEANWPTLQYLHTPVLQELDLEFYEDHFYCYVSDAGLIVAQEIEDFVKRSRCDSTLSRIRLAFVMVDNAGFKYLLERLPPIRHLTLDHFIVPSDFFQHAREDKCQLLPRLEVFEWFDVLETIQFEHVCHFFARRFRSKHPVQALKKLHMVYRSHGYPTQETFRPTPTLESLIDAHSLHPVKSGTSARGEEPILSLGPKNIDDEEGKLQETEELCPALRVPAEVLGEKIFKFALALIEHSIPGSRSEREQLIELCLVCKRWRQTAIDTPSLWAVVEISDQTFSKTVSRKVEKWLKRAGGVPKTLELDTFCDVCFGSCSLNSVHLAKFMITGPILRRLSISCRGWECVDNLLIALKKERTKNGQVITHWNAIQDLCIDLLDNWCRGIAFDRAHLKTIYSLLPPVTSFELAYSYCDREAGDLIPRLYIPKPFLARLTKLSFDSSDVANFSNVLPVLKACHLVEDLCLCLGHKMFRVRGNPDLSSHRDLLPRMRKLRLRAPDMQCLRHFRSPMLEELDIGCSGSWGDAPNAGEEAIGRHVPDFIDRSQCHIQLRRLKIQWMSIQATTLEHLLRQLPYLNHIALKEVEVDPLLFLRLAIGSPTALPLLSTLELERLHFPAVYARDYIQARYDLVQDDGTPVVQTQLKIGNPSWLYHHKEDDDSEGGGSEGSDGQGGYGDGSDGEGAAEVVG